MDNVGEPITSEEEESDTSRHGEEDEEERERDMLKQIMQQHGEHRGTATTLSANAGKQQQQRESLASRYYRNRNLTWTKDSQNNVATTNYVKTNNKDNIRRNNKNNSTIIPVRDGYVCHICGNKGHHIRNCPLGSDPRRAKKIKPATGLPRSWLKRIKEEDVARLDCDIYTLPDGTFAILEDNGPVSVPVEKKLVERYGITNAANIHEHLRCPLCSGLFQDAVLVSCCGESFCSNCVTSKIIETGSSCPSCSCTVLESDLTINEAIQQSVDAVLRVGTKMPTETSLFVPNTSQTIPPGTVRKVNIQGRAPVPLGGRLFLK